MQSSEPALLDIYNGDVFDVSTCPNVDAPVFRQRILDGVSKGNRISALFGTPLPDETIRLYCVLADDNAGRLRLVSSDVSGSYPSLTPECPQAHMFERELFEQWGIMPENHPWLKPVRFQSPMGGKNPPSSKIGETDFFQLTGEEAHEVAVGPVHAGVIEPGHFRFQCHGETVYHLEISLGYQHRGIERTLAGGPYPLTPHHMETLSGDTTIGHMGTYCRMVEHLAGIASPPRGQAIRGIAAELERIANHIGDIGAMSGDVGFLPTMSYCGRIRGDALNMTGVLCGNRFGRGLVVPGGTAWDIDDRLCGDLLKRLDAIENDATSAIELLFDTPSVLARFENTGKVDRKMAHDIGLVGPAARACGLGQDIRYHYAYGIYNYIMAQMYTWKSGDCFARAYIRWLEIQESIAFIRGVLGSLPTGETRHPWNGSMQPNRMSVTLTEGWRGEICHVAGTDDQGKFAFYKIVDPSFHNWFGLSLALRNQQISDFPLCNKSFNLSYCGHDL
ncbi:MAG: NADH-quinone oxidoreductase subunit C [Desulfobacteraceae bacterium]|nr:NADH-quinone oxidoreductase subunit C [Desulfobacteraceae bacterium]